MYSRDLFTRDKLNGSKCPFLKGYIKLTFKILI